jgi:hypothetical protein
MKAINFLRIKLERDITEIHRQFCHLLSFVSLLQQTGPWIKFPVPTPRCRLPLWQQRNSQSLSVMPFVSDDLGHNSRQQAVPGLLGHLQRDLHLQRAKSPLRDNDGEREEESRGKRGHLYSAER